MFAIIQTGAKQYKVKKDDTLLVEKIDIGKGVSHRFDQVLLISDGDKTEIGRPYLKGAYVEADLVDQIRGRKLVSFKYRRRESERTKIGHRQSQSKIRIKNIVTGNQR